MNNHGGDKGNSGGIDAEFNYKLSELVGVEFKLEEDDEDFDLSNEQLVKVMKM